MKSWPRRLLWSAAPLAIAASLLVAPAGRAMAQAIAEQLATCKKEGGGLSTRIAACTWIIDKAKHNEDIRIEAHLHRGVLHERAGDKEAAIKDYSDVIALDAGNALAHFNRGNVHDQQGDHDRAIADYTQAIKIDATDADVFNNRGQTYEYKGEYTLAITDYTESIRLNPKNAGAFFNRGSAYEQLGEHDRAIADYSESIRLDASDPEVFNSRGQAYDYVGNHDLAIADYNQSIRLSRDNPRSYFNRGVAHANKDDYKAAEMRLPWAMAGLSISARRLREGARDSARARGCPGVACATGKLEARFPRLPRESPPTRNGRSVGSGRRIP